MTIYALVFVFIIPILLGVFGAMVLGFPAFILVFPLAFLSGYVGSKLEKASRVNNSN